MSELVATNSETLESVSQLFETKSKPPEPVLGLKQPLTHPTNRAIALKMLAEHKSYQEVARKFGLSGVAVGKFARRYAHPAMEAAAKVLADKQLASGKPTLPRQSQTVSSLVPAAEALLQRIHTRYAEVDKRLPAASDGDAAKLMGVDSKLMQLHAEMTGAINRQPVQDNRQVVVIMPDISSGQLANGPDPETIDIKR